MRLNETVLRYDSYLNRNFDVHINTHKENKNTKTYVDHKLLSYKYERSFSEDGRTQQHQTDERKRKHITSKSNSLLDVFLFKSITKVKERKKFAHRIYPELDIANNIIFTSNQTQQQPFQPFFQSKAIVCECRFTYYMAFI